MTSLYILQFIYIIILGSAIGSFLNVLIWRTRFTSDNFKKRSVCFSCHKILEARNLVPVFSFLYQKGKTTCCNKKMPRQYIYVELANMFAYIIIFLLFSLTKFSLLILFPVISLLVLLASYDLLYGELPHKWTIVGIIYLLIIYLFLDINILNNIFAILIGSGFFIFQIIISKGKWVGGGDVGMGAFMGAILGFPLVIIGLFLSYIIGAAHVILLLILKKKKMGDAIPFGGYLVAGTLVSLFFGNNLLNWYLTLAGF